MSIPSKSCLDGDDIFTVAHVLSENECNDLISLSESHGFEAATVHTAVGHQMLSDWRNNTRVTIDDAERALELWKRVRSFVPDTIDQWQAVGINERLRFYRYDPGQQFDWHTDGYYQRDNGERSFLTFMVYLNGDMRGGETSFEGDRASSSPGITVRPEAGLALFFTHMLNHKGEPVIEGRKYVLRSDVMYAR